MPREESIMKAFLNYVGCGFVALSVLACGSKGSDDDEGSDTGGSGGSSGSSTGGSSSGGTATGGTATGGTATGGTATGGTATGGGAGKGTSELRNGFDTDTESWVVEYTSSGTLIAGGTAPLIDKSTVLLVHNADDGDPDPGTLEATIPYETEAQYVGIGVNYAAAVDMSNSVLTAHVRIKSGLGEATDLLTNPGGAKLYAKSGTGYCYAAGTYNNLTMIGTWMTIRFDMTRPPDYVDANCAVAFDPSDVLEIGVQFDTGGTSMSATEAVVNIDSIAY
jgi:hypothetical protein